MSCVKNSIGAGNPICKQSFLCAARPTAIRFGTSDQSQCRNFELQCTSGDFYGHRQTRSPTLIELFHFVFLAASPAKLHIPSHSPCLTQHNQECDTISYFKFGPRLVILRLTFRPKCSAKFYNAKADRFSPMTLSAFEKQTRIPSPRSLDDHAELQLVFFPRK